MKKVGSKASLDDLKEIKESLLNVVDKSYDGNLVFEAARNGDLKLMKLFFETSYDMNSRGAERGNIFVEACRYSKSTEMVQLIIRSSKDHGIDLNLCNIFGLSGFQAACWEAPLEIAKLLLENYKESGIDINTMNQLYKGGVTALDYIKFRLEGYFDEVIEGSIEEWQEFKSTLEEEYAKINSLDNADNAA